MSGSPEAEFAPGAIELLIRSLPGFQAQSDPDIRATRFFEP